MRIQIIGQNSVSGISGGRLSSWLLGESLASLGCRVVYTTNNKPLFVKEFQKSRVKINISSFKASTYFSDRRNCKRYDWSIVIPHYGNYELMKKIWDYAKKTSNKVAFFNFETINFIDDYFYPNNFDPNWWKPWKMMCEQSDIIISNSKITQDYAIEYYNVDASKFIFWLTSINNWMIDKFRGKLKKKKQILCITRAEAKKGLGYIPQLLSSELSGYKLIICIGTGKIDENLKKELDEKCNKFNIELKIAYNVLGKEKAKLLCESKVLLYPSTFESFGMPPLEALYSYLPVIAFDLPSYCEFDNKLILKSRIGDLDHMKRNLNEVLNNNENYVTKIKNNIIPIEKIAQIESSAKELLGLLQEMKSQKKIKKIGFEILYEKNKRNIIRIYKIISRIFDILPLFISEIIKLLLPKIISKKLGMIDKKISDCDLGIGNDSFGLGNIDYKIVDRSKLLNLHNKHKGQRCFILGNGPSLCVDDIEKLRDEVTFASNKIYLLFDQTTWRPTYYNVEDTLVASQNVEEINRVDGTTKFFPTYLINQLGMRFKNGIYYDSLANKIENDNFPGFSNRPGKNLFWGSTVVYIQMQFAAFMGFNEIYLLGVDYSYTESKKKDGDMLISDGEQNHFHKDYRKPGEKWYKPNLKVHEKTFTKVEKEYSKEFGFKVYNATRGGKLEIFERVNLEDVLEEKS